MRVLHVFNELKPSGAEVMWRQAEPILRENGIETHIFEASDSCGSYCEEMKRAGYTIHRGSLWRLLRETHFDAAVVHTERRRFTHVIICKIGGVRVVVSTIHNVFKWSGKSYLKRLCIIQLLRVVGCKFVAVSPSVQCAERMYGHVPKLIWNWVSGFEPCDKLNGDKSQRVLITVGNCNEAKNHCFLFEVLNLLPENYILWHVGLEDESNSHERETVEMLGIEARVVFWGARYDIRSLMSKADIFVMSSIKEGLGNACVEALMMGLPAVVSDVDGLRDIGSIVGSCRCVPLDPNVFADAIRNVFDSVTSVRRQRFKDYEKLTRIFSMADNVAQYIELWKGK